MKWNYTLETGKALRFAIHDGDETGVILALKKCYEEIIDKKQIELECDFDEVEIVSCSSYLEIIWNNLISNAIKFTENGGKITVKLKKDRSKVVFEVSDTGCGISQETGARIFDKFYQGDTSHATQGNGLGLALVKRVVDIMQGEIAVESTMGVGTTFTVRIGRVENGPQEAR